MAIIAGIVKRPGEGHLSMYNLRQQLYPYRHLIMITTGLVVSIVVGLSIMTHFMRSGKIATTFAIMPSHARLTINGKNSPKGTLWLKPGVYDITVNAGGFESIEKQVIVSSEKSQNVVAASLSAESDEAKKWADRHAGDYQNNQQFGSIEANQNGEYMRKKHPIITKLPYTDPYYKIAYTLKNSQEINLTITTPSPRYRYFAVQKIRELGYDPTNYHIEFRDYKNPLALESKS